MTDPPPPPPRFVILSAVDATDRALHVLHATAKIAGAPDVELHLLHVIPPKAKSHPPGVSFAPLTESARDQRIEEGAQYLARQTAFLQERAERQVFPHLMSGVAWQTVVQLATDLAADLLVIGTHDATGIERLFLGSAAEIISRAAPCPVLVAREKQNRTLDVPTIEPPCAACLETQQRTRGSRLWCVRHSQHHPRAHTYHEMSQDSYGSGSSSFRRS